MHNSTMILETLSGRIAFMANDELLSRIDRIYASVDATQEFDMTKLPGIVWQQQGRVGFYQDFRSGLSQAEIENIAHSLISNIANLKDHLRRWARHNGTDPAKIDQAVKASYALNIIIDLDNNEKHGYPPWHGGHSGVAPQVPDIRRVMRLSTGGEAGSGVGMTFNSDGTPRIMSRGSGSAKAVITGDVIDKDGNKLGDLHEFEQDAVEALEKLLADLGIT